MLLRSPIFDTGRPGTSVLHSFSTREGGVSGGCYASLNLGKTVGDSPGAVQENRRRYLAESGFSSPVVEVSQVHGTRALEATVGAVDRGEFPAIEADAVWTEVPGLPVGVRTADCVPVLLAALDKTEKVRAVAAIHAGWRGATAGVIEAVVSALARRNHHPARMRAALGPAIGPAAFEVGPEVIDAARTSLGGEEPKTTPGDRGRPLLDLPDLVLRHLVRAGLELERVHSLDCCTHSDAHRFFSHRRDAGRTGRHLSAIQIAS